MKNNFLLGLLGILLLGACNTKYPTEVEGYQPIYLNKAEQYTIETLAAQPYETPGKIYKYGNFTFQLEKGKGVHIINSTDPANPSKVKFINVPGATEISIKDNMLYSNNFDDLVTLNIADINNISVASRSKGVFPIIYESVPPSDNSYFECVDESRGIVIGWKLVTLKNPKCFLP